MQPNKKNTERSCADIVKVAKVLPTDVRTDIFQDEWKMLQLEKIENTKNKKFATDDYWKLFITLKFPCGALKYSNVVQMIRIFWHFPMVVQM